MPPPGSYATTGQRHWRAGGCDRSLHAANLALSANTTEGGQKRVELLLLMDATRDRHDGRPARAAVVRADRTLRVLAPPFRSTGDAGLDGHLGTAHGDPGRTRPMASP